MSDWDPELHGHYEYRGFVIKRRRDGGLTVTKLDGGPVPAKLKGHVDVGHVHDLIDRLRK